MSRYQDSEKKYDYRGIITTELTYRGIKIWQHRTDLEFGAEFVQTCRDIQNDLKKPDLAQDALLNKLTILTLRFQFETAVSAADTASIMRRRFYSSESRVYCKRLFDAVFHQCQERLPILKNIEWLKLMGRAELSEAAKSTINSRRNITEPESTGRHASLAEVGFHFASHLQACSLGKNTSFEKIKQMEQLMDAIVTRSYLDSQGERICFSFETDLHDAGGHRTHCFHEVKGSKRFFETMRTIR